MRPAQTALSTLTHSLAPALKAVDQVRDTARALATLTPRGAYNLDKIEHLTTQALDSTRNCMHGRELQMAGRAVREANDILGNARTVFGKMWRTNHKLEQALQLSRQATDLLPNGNWRQITLLGSRN